jgi:hypothetical protein
MPKKKKVPYLDKGETEESYKKDFINYAHGYYGKGRLFDMGLTKKQVGQAYDDLMQNDEFFKEDPWREKIRMYWQKRGKSIKKDAPIIFQKRNNAKKFRR